MVGLGVVCLDGAVEKGTQPIERGEGGGGGRLASVYYKVCMHVWMDGYFLGKKVLCLESYLVGPCLGLYDEWRGVGAVGWVIGPGPGIETLPQDDNDEPAALPSPFEAAVSFRALS